jgi:hypothetical protein
MKSYLLRGILGLALSCFAVSRAAATNVKVELALLVDVSGSVDNTEYNLQKTGYVNAFNNAAIQTLIANTPGGIAVAYIEWSGSAQQSTLVNWTHLTDATSAGAFATAIAGTARAFSGQTAPGSAINYAVTSIANNTFTGEKKVIDVSGDGQQNDGFSTSTARNNALAAGIDRINGIAIGAASLQTWYANNIQGGTGSFTLGAESFATFQNALNQKLTFEITGTNPSTPEGGSTVALLTVMLGAIAFFRRRQAV